MANIPLKLSFLSVATSEIHKCVHNVSVACKAGAIFGVFLRRTKHKGRGVERATIATGEGAETEQLKNFKTIFCALLRRTCLALLASLKNAKKNNASYCRLTVINIFDTFTVLF